MSIILDRRLGQVLLVGVLLLPSARALCAVIQCTDASGSRYFGQFHCPPGTTLIDPEPDRVPGLSVVRTAPLSKEERHALAELEKSLAAARRDRARNSHRTARQRSARVVEEQQRCTEALQHLEALADSRRRGYKAGAEHRLEAEEDHWRAVRRSSC